MKTVCLLSVSLLWLVCKACGGEVFHPDAFKAVKQGNAVTMTCWISDTLRIRVWYKLTPGRRLQPVASTDTLYNLTTFKKQSHRYVVVSENSRSHLSITSATWEDAGTYYCGVMNLQDIEFGLGTILIIIGANPLKNSVIQQPEYESVHSGASVTLSCSVHADHCTAEQTSVSWLKSTDHSDLEMIFASRDMNNTHQRTKLGSEEPTCVYTFLMRNLHSVDAGTYYCAVNIDGRILYGNGTEISVQNTALTKSAVLSPAVIALILSNVVLGIVTLLLVRILCKNKKNPAAPGVSDGSAGSYQSEVVYATVRAAPRISSCRPAPVKPSEDSTIYSDINH